MGFENSGVPWATQAGTFGAEMTRRAVFSGFARTAANSPGILAGGLLSAADLQMTNAGSGLVVNISTGECIIGGTEGGVQGGYYGRNTATASVTLATANPTNPRIDAVVAMVADAAYAIPSGGTSGLVTFVGVTGTPTAGATLSNLSGAPATPASSLLLGYVLVPANASNLVGADVANKATIVQPQRGLAISQPIRYHRAAALTFTTGAWTVLSVDTQDFDASGGQYTLSGGALVVPAAGYYQVQVNVTATNTTSAFFMVAAVGHNGTQTGSSSSTYSAASTPPNPSASASDIVQCAAGDTLSVMYYFPASGFTMFSGGTPPGNSLTVARVL